MFNEEIEEAMPNALAAGEVVTGESGVLQVAVAEYEDCGQCEYHSGRCLDIAETPAGCTHCTGKYRGDGHDVIFRKVTDYEN